MAGYPMPFAFLFKDRFLFLADRPGNPATWMEGTELEFVIMVIAVSCVKLLSAHNSTQHTSRSIKCKAWGA
jgi:hypothetical protein